MSGVENEWDREDDERERERERGGSRWWHWHQQHSRSQLKWLRGASSLTIVIIRPTQLFTCFFAWWKRWKLDREIERKKTADTRSEKNAAKATQTNMRMRMMQWIREKKRKGKAMKQCSMYLCVIRFGTNSNIKSYRIIGRICLHFMCKVTMRVREGWCKKKETRVKVCTRAWCEGEGEGQRKRERER